MLFAPSVAFGSSRKALCIVCSRYLEARGRGCREDERDHLLEANVGGPLAEALTADHKVVLTDKTVVGGADAAERRRGKVRKDCDRAKTLNLHATDSKEPIKHGASWSDSPQTHIPSTQSEDWRRGVEGEASFERGRALRLLYPSHGLLPRD